jgi:hypothetical protein
MPLALRPADASIGARSKDRAFEVSEIRRSKVKVWLIEIGAPAAGMLAIAPSAKTAALRFLIMMCCP